MSTLEHLFMHIFDRKKWTVDQMKEQSESYEQSLAIELTASGRPPPPWLLHKGSVLDAPGCSNLTELNGKQINPDILFPSSRFTTPSNQNTFSIPNFNYSQTLQNITNKQINKTLINEPITETQLLTCNEENEPSTNTNPEIQLPNLREIKKSSLIQRSRSRQRAIEKRSSATSSLNPSVRDKPEGLGVEDLICTENDAVEPKRLSFDAVLGNEIHERENEPIREENNSNVSFEENNNNNKLLDQRSELEAIETEPTDCIKNRANEQKNNNSMEIDELIVEQERTEFINCTEMDAGKLVSPNVGEPMEINDCTAIDATEPGNHNSKEPTDCIENRANEQKNNCTENDATEPGNHNSYKPMEIYTRKDIDACRLENPETSCTEIDALENLDSYEPTETGLEKSNLDGPTEITPVWMDINADVLEQTSSERTDETPSCTEIDAARLENLNPALEKTGIVGSPEIMNHTEIDAPGLEKPSLKISTKSCTEISASCVNDSEPTQIAVCTENDAGGFDKQSLEKSTETPRSTDIYAYEFENPEPTETPSRTVTDAAELENPEPAQIPDFTETDASRVEKPAIDGLGKTAVCTENNADWLEKPDCTETDASRVEKPAIDGLGKTAVCTENNADWLEKPSLEEIPSCTEIDAVVLEKTVEMQNDSCSPISVKIGDDKETTDTLIFEHDATETLICTEIDAVELKTEEKTIISVGEGYVRENEALVYACGSYSPIVGGIRDETLICTEINADELETGEKIRVTVGEGNVREIEALVYARDSYSPIVGGIRDETLNCTEIDAAELRKGEETRVSVCEGYKREMEAPVDDRTGDDSEKREKVVQEPIMAIKDSNNINNALLEAELEQNIGEIEIETEIDPKCVYELNLTASDKGKSVLLQSGESLESGIKRQVDNIQSHDDVNNSFPKKRKIQNFLSDSALASSSRAIKEKEESFTEPVQCEQNEEAQLSIEKFNFSEEAQLPIEEFNFSDPNYISIQNDKGKAPLISPDNFSLTPLEYYNKITKLKYSNETELEGFKMDPEDPIMPELEGFSMEISPIFEGKSVNNHLIMSLSKELFSSSKNFPTPDPFNSFHYDSNKKSVRRYSPCLFNSETGISFSRSETRISFPRKSATPPPSDKLRIQSSGKLGSSNNMDLTCFRIDEDSEIEESEVPNDKNALEEILAEQEISEEAEVAGRENDQNALEENLPEEDGLKAGAMDWQNDKNALLDSLPEEGNSEEGAADRTNNQNALEENIIEEAGWEKEAEASEVEIDQNALREVTDFSRNMTRGKVSVPKGQGRFGNTASMKPKISAASSIKGNEERKANKSIRAGSSFKGPEINPNRVSHKVSNIVSNVSSFVSLVKQKQRPVVKKREIRVPALEAAEAKKRQDEKKRNEKEMQKLEREREMKRRQEEIKRKQEEELRKKIDAELANKKRQREERERKEREKKRKLNEEKEKTLAQLEEQFSKLPVRKAEAGPSSVIVKKEKKKKEKEYEMSPYQNSDEEPSDDSDAEEERRKNKYHPPWAMKDNLENLRAKLFLDPKPIFMNKRPSNWAKLGLDQKRRV